MGLLTQLSHLHKYCMKKWQELLRVTGNFILNTPDEDLVAWFENVHKICGIKYLNSLITVNKHDILEHNCIICYGDLIATRSWIIAQTSRGSSLGPQTARGLQSLRAHEISKTSMIRPAESETPRFLEHTERAEHQDLQKHISKGLVSWKR